MRRLFKFLLFPLAHFRAAQNFANQLSHTNSHFCEVLYSKKTTGPFAKFLVFSGCGQPPCIQWFSSRAE